MRRTTFQFGLRTRVHDAEALKTLLRDKLCAIQGVEDVVLDGEAPVYSLKVLVVFADGEAAERIHNKTATTIEKDGIQIAWAETNPTEIFG